MKNGKYLNGTELIYSFHNRKRRQKNTSVLKERRSELLNYFIGKNKKVLDIGCRDGLLTGLYSEGNYVLGVDIDAESLMVAKNSLNINTRQMDLNDEWDFESESFDVVVAGEFLEHIYYPEIVLDKIFNTLKPGGKLVGSVPNAFNLKNRLRLFFGNKKGTPLEDSTHINHFSRKELIGLLNKKFKNVRIIPLGRYQWLDKFLPGLFSFGLFFVAEK